MITQLKRIRILFACLFFICPTFLFSQKKTLPLNQGRLFTAEGIEMKFVNLNQQGSVITIQSRKGKFDIFDQNEILRIEQKTGTEALLWGSSLGAIALVEGMLLARLMKSPSYFTPSEERERDQLIVAGSTVLGALIGLLVGASRIKYKKIYDDPTFSFSARKVRLNFSSPSDISCLTLKYHF